MLPHYSTAGERAALEQPLRELLRHFSYKPGWEFFVRDGYLEVRADVPDAYNPSQTIQVFTRVALPQHLPYHGEFPWQRWLFHQILDVERHEAGEFFVIAGTRPFDPHT